ncbi:MULTISPECIES: hypothetical protein [unclassified Labrenzia]|uniref:hypothetical protein n=1 Tax=unclassified Labrenzia TaxID=2648686 RepID=UPI0004CEDE29|nr:MULTISPECIES: hypothetical protein [unclassified Labrenzia]
MSKDNNVARFPVSTWKRIWNRRGKRTINCIVSDRYLRYGDLAPSSAGYFPDQLKIGTPVTIDVMSDNAPDEREPRKLCQLIVTVEELREMVAQLDKDLAETDE